MSVARGGPRAGRQMQSKHASMQACKRRQSFRSEQRVFMFWKNLWPRATQSNSDWEVKSLDFKSSRKQSDEFHHLWNHFQKKVNKSKGTFDRLAVDNNNSEAGLSMRKLSDWRRSSMNHITIYWLWSPSDLAQKKIQRVLKPLTVKSLFTKTTLQ